MLTGIGGRIAVERGRLGLTQWQLARRAGIGRVTLVRIENGQQDPTVTTLVRIADALGVTPQSLFPARGGRR